MRRIHALVLAGKSELRAVEDERAADKPRYPVCGRPMYEYVIDAVVGSRMIDRILVTLPTSVNSEAVRKKSDRIRCLHSDSGVVENVCKAIDYLEDADYIVAISSDLPLLTPESIDAFIQECLAEGEYDLYYPVLRKDDLLSQYPGAQRTFTRVADGVFTGGNVIMFRPEIVKNNLKVFKRMFEERKSPVGMARVIGLFYALKLVTGSLSIAEIESRISKMIGGRGRAVISGQAAIGMDVDKKEDLLLVEEILSYR